MPNFIEFVLLKLYRNGGGKKEEKNENDENLK